MAVTTATLYSCAREMKGLAATSTSARAGAFISKYARQSNISEAAARQLALQLGCGRPPPWLSCDESRVALRKPPARSARLVRKVSFSFFFPREIRFDCACSVIWRAAVHKCGVVVLGQAVGDIAAAAHVCAYIALFAIHALKHPSHIRNSYTRLSFEISGGGHW